jgi:hypothetical protein
MEMMTGKQPKVSHILPFGANCTVYQHPERKTIARRADLGIILGVNDEVKGYNVWLPQQQKVIVTREVQAVSAPTPRRDIAEFLSQLGETQTAPSQPDGPSLTENSGCSAISGFVKPKPISTRPKKVHKVETPTQRTRAQRRATASSTDAIASANLTDATRLQELQDARVFLAIPEPRNAKEAVGGPNAKEWQDAMQKELDGLVANGTWEVVKRPSGGNVVSHKWVFKVKYDQAGQVDKFKARLVARGFTQRYGVDFSKTFAPVIKQASVRILFALAVWFNCAIHHLDFPQAYLKAATDFPIYFELPEAAGVNTDDHVGLLLKGLYGLKQSGMLWHELVDKTLLDLGLTRSQLDPCIYYMRTTNGLTCFGLYVDDILAFSQDSELLKSLVNKLKELHQVNDLGAAKRVLGMNVQRTASGIFLSQEHMVKELLVKHGLSDAKPQKTPMAIDHGFFEDGEPATMSESELREIVGSLLWIAGSTRPDISYATNVLARYITKANNNHCLGAKRILRYLKGTMDYGLTLNSSHVASTDPMTLDIFGDADWAGDHTNRRSTSGCATFLNGCLVQWSSKQQAVVALSTMEAEYIASSMATQDCMWSSQLLHEMDISLDGAPRLWCDNQSAIKSMESDISKTRAKHIDIRYHYVRESVRGGKIDVDYCETGKMPADLFTKALTTEIFERLRDLNCIRTKPPLDTPKEDTSALVEGA